MIAALPVITLEAVLTYYLEQWDGMDEDAAAFPLGGVHPAEWTSMIMVCRPYIAERLAYIMSEEAERELYVMLMCYQTETGDPKRLGRKSDIARALLKVRVLWHSIQATIDAAAAVNRSEILVSMVQMLRKTMLGLPDGIPSLVAACLEPVFTKHDLAWWLPEYQWWQAVQNSSRDGVTTWN
jgi:hypothetical protein